MILIAGLGNPGTKYLKTLHNVGFMAVELLAEKNGAEFDKKGFKGLFGTKTIGGEKVVFLKPQTFMNLSGESIREIAAYFKIPSENILVIYDDIDIDKINTNSLLKNVTMVSQSTYLFEETIEDNLRIAKPDATREEIENTCKMASIHDFIMTLPDGYKTQVGALGDNLSAGEKQRIGLARAFLRGSELILLDEPTSNVDSINEGIILKALKEQKNKKSIILVSHRESTMAIADRIYKVDGGVMTEEA